MNWNVYYYIISSTEKIPDPVHMREKFRHQFFFLCRNSCALLFSWLGLPWTQFHLFALFAPLECFYMNIKIVCCYEANSKLFGLCRALDAFVWLSACGNLNVVESFICLWNVNVFEVIGCPPWGSTITAQYLQ